MADEPNGWKITMRPFIGFMVILGTFASFFLVGAGYADIVWEKVIFLVIGAELAWVGSIVSWYYGSSEGSAKKTDAMIREMK